MKYANRLRVIRAEKRITQMDLALKVGMGHNRLWRIENGYAEPTTAERLSIARVLGVPEVEAFPEPIAS